MSFADGKEFVEVRHGSFEVEGVADRLGTNAFLERDLRYTGIPPGTIQRRLFFRVLTPGGPHYACEIPLKKGRDLTAGDKVAVSGRLVEVRYSATNAFHHYRLDGCRLKARQRTEQSMPPSVEGTVKGKAVDTKRVLIRLTVSDAEHRQFSCALDPVEAQEYDPGKQIRITGYAALPADEVSAIAECSVSEYDGRSRFPSRQ